MKASVRMRYLSRKLRLSALWRVGRRLQRELLAARQREVPAVGAIGAVSRLITLDDDFGAGWQRCLGHTAPEQRVRRAALDHPFHRLAVAAFHVDMDPRVRIDPF